MTMPRTILLFAAAYGALLLVNLVHGVIAADSLRLVVPEFADMLGDGFVPIMLAVRFAFAAWLGWLIIRRASNIAKWFVVVLMVLKLRSLGDAWEGLQSLNVNSILWTLGTVLGLFAVVFLFAPASRYWFASKGRSVTPMLQFSNSIAVTIGAAMLAYPAASFAQAYQCQVPQTLPSVPAVSRDGPIQRGEIAGYTLALSWSPEYCRGREDRAADRRQCSGRQGRFGFVVHGLWPVGRAASPQWCPAPNKLTAKELSRNLCMTPSAALLAREWARHGSCMVKRPESYFKVTRILWNSLRWPDYDRLSRRPGLTAGEIRTAFAEANRYWEAEHVGLVVNERGWLEEMRLCYGKDFMPTRCSAGRYGPRDSSPVKIWRGLWAKTIFLHGFGLTESRRLFRIVVFSAVRRSGRLRRSSRYRALRRESVKRPRERACVG